MKGLAKSQIKQGLNKVRPRAGSELALIPNETNKVRHAQIIQNILEYSNQIHMDKYICNKNE
jgi:hypothetical protein